MTTARRIALLVLPAATVALWTFALVLGVAVSRVPGGLKEPLGMLFVIAIPTLVIAAVGVVVASKRPDHRVGWVLSVVPFLVAVRAATDGWVLHGPAVFGPDLPGRAIVGWVSVWVWVPAMGTIGTFFFLLFPTGRPPTPRWRIVGWTAAVGIGGAVLSSALRHGPLEDYPSIANPFGVPRLASVLDIVGWSIVLLLVAIAASVASLVVRARSATFVERQQIKWIAFAGAFFVLGFSSSVITGRFDTIGAIGVFGPIAGLAVAAGIAIQRYQLYDIDRIISRTLAYALVTALLGGTFASLVLLPPVVLGGESAPDHVIAVATLVVAALFRPVRRRVQDAVDHRFNRRRYDAEHTIDAFTARLREQVDIDALGAELTDVVVRTMRPAHASVWLRQGSR